MSSRRRAVLFWSYWWGEPTVVAAWERVPKGRRREFLLYLHGCMHSNTTVGMFLLSPHLGPDGARPSGG